VFLIPRTGKANYYISVDFSIYDINYVYNYWLTKGVCLHSYENNNNYN